MKRLAVFDIDGTLVDSRRSIADAVRDAWLALDLEPPGYDATRQIVGLSLLDAVQVLAPDLAPARYPELGLAYKNAFIANRAAGLDEPLYCGARDALDALKRDGWLLGIATGKSRRGIEHARCSMQLSAPMMVQANPIRTCCSSIFARSTSIQRAPR